MSVLHHGHVRHSAKDFAPGDMATPVNNCYHLYSHSDGHNTKECEPMPIGTGCVGIIIHVNRFGHDHLPTVLLLVGNRLGWIEAWCLRHAL